jgi:hypothetical protein
MSGLRIANVPIGPRSRIVADEIAGSYRVAVEVTRPGDPIIADLEQPTTHRTPGAALDRVVKLVRLYLPAGR